MFTFVDENWEFSSFISKDPIFNGLVGFQKTLDFLTPERVQHITSELCRVHDCVEQGNLGNPLGEFEAHSMLHAFSVCMTKCEGGETSGASYAMLIPFM